MQKSINKQKLIIINGVINSGKTVVFNLFRKEDNYICLDISDCHYHIYKHEIIDQLGEKNTLKLEENINNTYIFKTEIFLREMGLLMKKFPQYSFVIKPAFKTWLADMTLWNNLVKEYLPIPSTDIHQLFILRHPKIGWITNTLRKSNIDAFIGAWTTEYWIDEIERYQVIKIEEIKHNELLKSLIKKTDLNDVLPYSNFDLQVKISNEIDNDFEHIEKQFKQIELNLGYFIKHFNYNIDDENISKFMKDSLTEEELKINWVEE